MSRITERIWTEYIDSNDTKLYKIDHENDIFNLKHPIESNDAFHSLLKQLYNSNNTNKNNKLVFYVDRPNVTKLKLSIDLTDIKSDKCDEKQIEFSTTLSNQNDNDKEILVLWNKLTLKLSQILPILKKTGEWIDFYSIYLINEDIIDKIKLKLLKNVLDLIVIIKLIQNKDKNNTICLKIQVMLCSKCFCKINFLDFLCQFAKNVTQKRISLCKRLKMLCLLYNK